MGSLTKLPDGPLDFRVAAYLEGRECLRLIEKMSIEQPEFLANLIGACINFSLASLPTSVLEGAAEELDRRDCELERVRKHIKEALGG